MRRQEVLGAGIGPHPGIAADGHGGACQDKCVRYCSRLCLGHNGSRSVLAEQHDEWAESRRYLSLDVLSKSQADRNSPTEQEDVPAALTA